MAWANNQEKSLWTRRYREENRRKAVEYLGGCCKVCGSGFLLEFHHKNPKTKFSHRIWDRSWTVILGEIRKCILLCRTHHKLLHRLWIRIVDGDQDAKEHYNRVFGKFAGRPVACRSYRPNGRDDGIQPVSTDHV